MNQLEQLCLRQRATVKDEAIATAMKRDASLVSKIFANDSGVRLSDMEPFLAALGLKVVHLDAVCIRRDAHEALRVFAEVGVSCRCAAQGGDYCSSR